MQTKISYVVQEAIVVIKDIFRRYPNQYESIIGTLCENLDALDEPEAKAAMIWIVGQYADRIENSDELLEDFMFTFKEEPAEVSSKSTHFFAETSGAIGPADSNCQTFHQAANSSTGASAKGSQACN